VSEYDPFLYRSPQDVHMRTLYSSTYNTRKHGTGYACSNTSTVAHTLCVIARYRYLSKDGLRTNIHTMQDTGALHIVQMTVIHYTVQS
jgi:hypothetical protein